MIAKHVMNIHMNRPNQSADDNGETVGEIDIDKMKRYIAYCKRFGVIPYSFKAFKLIPCSSANVHRAYPPMLKKCSAVILSVFGSRFSKWNAIMTNGARFL